MVINMKYKVAIVDQDTAYLERLVNFWDKHRKETNGAAKIIVDEFYNKSTFLQKSEENFYDVVCVGDMVDFEADELPEDTMVVYLISNEDEPSKNQLRKYQKPETLYEQLLYFCENSADKGKREKNVNSSESNPKKPVFITNLIGNCKCRECELPNDSSIDRVALGMLQSRTVPGIASISLQERPESIVLRYDITGKISLREYYDSISHEEVDADFIETSDGYRTLAIIRSFIDTALCMEDYLMNAQNIIWDIDNLYIDEKTHETAVLYCPTDEGEDIYTSLQALNDLKKLIAGLDMQDEVSVMDSEPQLDEYCEDEYLEQEEELNEQENENQIYDDEETLSPDEEDDDDEYIVTANESDLEEHAGEKENKRHFGKNHKSGKRAVHDIGSTYTSFTHEKDEYEDDGYEEELPYSVEDMEAQPKKGLSALWPWRNKTADRDAGQEPEQKISNSRSSRHNISNNEVYYDDEESGETEIFDDLQPQFSDGNEEDSYETTVLGEEQNVYYLLRRKNKEKIVINRPVFKIGKEKNYVDYCIDDNAAVSRNHADIVVQNGEYYIRDNDSLNHTYINGTMIPVNENTALYEEDVIFIANEAFVFKKEKLK